MKKSLQVTPGFACKRVEFDQNHSVPWLTSVNCIALDNHIAHLGPPDGPMEAIGRAFTRHLWNTGLLDDYVLERLEARPPTVFTCVLSLSFYSEGKFYDVRLAFEYGEREPGKKASVNVTEEELAQLLFSRIVEGDMSFSMVEARARHRLKLNSVGCVMNGLDLVVA